jgi:hypothetical protein
VWAWLAEHGTAAQLNELWTVCAATRLPTGPLTALDRPEGPDLARVPGWALAAANIVSCFRLQRRWRGALAGFEAAREQLAAVAAPAAAATIGRLDLGVVDLTSTGPSAPEARRFASRLVRRQPVVASDVVLGGLVARRLDAELARRAIGSWRAGRSLLRPDPLLIHAA